MRSILSALIIIAAAFMPSCNSRQDKTGDYVDISSANYFFRLADKISSGNEPSESEWAELFETAAYKKCIDETFEERGEFIREAMNLAFKPSMEKERDSLTSIPVVEIVSDWEALLIRVSVDNFMDIKNNKTEIQKQLTLINGAELMAKARKRLSDFLVDPVDSLIIPIPIGILCMEPDALSLSGMIVWDANLYCKQSEEEKVNLLAHEMFHAYRLHFAEKREGLLSLFNSWQNEGIADQIDKKSLSDLSSEFIRYGFPESYVDTYNDIYNNTPLILKEVEELTLSFLRSEIEEKTYNSKLSDFIQFGGHPNAFYMSTTIRNAGYEKEMISTFHSPADFVKLYNKSVGAEQAFGREFMDYLDTLN